MHINFVPVCYNSFNALHIHKLKKHAVLTNISPDCIHKENSQLLEVSVESGVTVERSRIKEDRCNKEMTGGVL